MNEGENTFIITHLAFVIENWAKGGSELESLTSVSKRVFNEKWQMRNDQCSMSCTRRARCPHRTEPWRASLRRCPNLKIQGSDGALPSKRRRADSPPCLDTPAREVRV